MLCWFARGSCQPMGLEGSLENCSHGSIYIVQEQVIGVDIACAFRDALVHYVVFVLEYALGLEMRCCRCPAYCSASSTAPGRAALP